MTTTTEVITCPFCENLFNFENLFKLGITHKELTILSNYIKNGMLKDMINMADIAIRRLDPEKLNTQLQITEGLVNFGQKTSEDINTVFKEIKDLLKAFSKDSEDGRIESLKEFENKMIQVTSQLQTIVQNNKDNQQEKNFQQFKEICDTLKEIRDKIIGVGKGNIGEIITIKDLKSASPMDSFSEDSSSKHGTDIVAIVKQNGIEYGKISISVKCVEKWESSFMKQLLDNMVSDGTKFGMLVTKVFPHQALNSKVYLSEDYPGKTIVCVKPEYVPLLYFGLRQSVLHDYETMTLVKSKEKQTDEMEQNFKFIKKWINSDEFQKSILQIDSAKKNVEEARNQLTRLRNYINTNIDTAIELQNSIEQALIQVLKTMIETKSVCNNDGNLQNRCDEGREE